MTNGQGLRSKEYAAGGPWCAELDDTAMGTARTLYLSDSWETQRRAERILRWSSMSCNL